MGNVAWRNSVILGLVIAGVGVTYLATKDLLVVGLGCWVVAGVYWVVTDGRW